MNDQENDEVKGIPIKMLCGHTLDNLTQNDEGALVCKACFRVFKETNAKKKYEKPTSTTHKQ